MEVTSAPNPCRHMRGILSSLADGRGGWLATLYAKAHLRRCPRCTAAMRALLALKRGLRHVGGNELGLGAERWAEIESACRDADEK